MTPVTLFRKRLGEVFAFLAFSEPRIDRTALSRFALFDLRSRPTTLPPCKAGARPARTPFAAPGTFARRALGGSAPSRRLCRSRRRREGAKNLRPAEMVASFGSDPRPPWLFRALPARVAAKDEPGGNRLRSPFPFSWFDPTWVATDSALSSSEVFKRASGRVLSSSLLGNSARCIKPIEAIQTPIFASWRKRQTHITVAY
jgi:hypothetical protein